MSKKGSAIKTVAVAALAGLMAFSFNKAENITSYEGSSTDHEARISGTKASKHAEIEVYTEEEYEAKRRMEQKKRIIKKISATVKGGAAFLTAFAIKFILWTAASLIGKPINSLFGFLADTVVNFMVIALLFALSFKMMYPGRKLRELFSVKNILLMYAASFILTALKYILALFSDKAYFAGVILQSVFTLLILSVLWYKIFNSEKAFGKMIKKIISSQKGKYVFIGIISATLLSAVIKLLIRKMHFLGAYCDLIMVFLICALVTYCGYMLFKPKKKVLLLN